MASLDELRAEIEQINQELRALVDRKNAVKKKLQAICPHPAWEYHQVAGEGKFCKSCGYHDVSDD